VKQHRQDALDAHVTRYGQMHDGLGRASTQEAVRDAVSLAFDHIVDRFQDLHQARQTGV
jgi:hypothetical protein